MCGDQSTYNDPLDILVGGVFVFILEVHQPVYELFLLRRDAFVSVTQCLWRIRQLRTEEITLEKLKISCRSTITYFWFDFDDVRRAVRRAVRLVLLLLRLFLFPLDGALHFRHHTFGPHPDAEALFQPALLALSPHVHVYLAVVAVLALVNRVLRYAASEEALASLAREGVVVVARGAVAAHEAQFLLLTGRGALFLLRVAAVGTVTVEAAGGEVLAAFDRKHTLGMGFICVPDGAAARRRVILIKIILC